MYSMVGWNIISYVAGKAEYRDILSPKTIHIAEFCFQLSDFALTKGDSFDSHLTALKGRWPSSQLADNEWSSRTGPKRLMTSRPEIALAIKTSGLALHAIRANL